MTVVIESPINLFTNNLREKDWFFSIYRKLTQDLKTKTATTFSPTLSGSGSMTISSPSIATSKYYAIGELVFIEFRATFTIGGTPDLSVQFDLPFNALVSGSMSCVVIDTSAAISGFALLSSGSKTVSVRRYDGANWGSGAGREIRISGHYSTSDRY